MNDFARRKFQKIMKEKREEKDKVKEWNKKEGDAMCKKLREKRVSKIDPKELPF